MRGCAAAGAALLWLLSMVAGASSAPSLDLQLRKALAIPPGVSAGIVVDLASGRTIFARNADLSLSPASNEKLAVTYAALTELGAGYRFRTELLGEGHRSGAVWWGNLVLKGFGDPTLTSHRIDLLAARLQQMGIRRVTGHVVGDDSWFDAQRGVTGWLREFFGNESPPLSALVVDRAVYKRHVVGNAALAAAAQLDRALWARGIDVRGAVTRAARRHTTLLATNESRQLWRLLRMMDAESDNFTAELVLKTLGAEKLGRGTSAAGAQVVARDLAAAGVPLAGVRIVDGSGLSRDDRVTARQLAAVLTAIWKRPGMRAVVVHALATPGSGTLKHRLLKKPTLGVVFAKTGTTNLASALSGYVADRYAFVVLQNGDPVDFAAAHEAQDGFVQALAARSNLR